MLRTDRPSPTTDVLRGLLVLCLTWSVWGSAEAQAQRTGGTVTLGLQVGQPGGVTAKLYRNATTAYDALVTTDGADFASLYVHRLWEHPFPSSSVHLYLGPGVFVGGRRLQTDPGLQLGLSGEVGLNFFAERFEVFLHITPTLRTFSSQHARLGGSVGLRYRLP